MSDGEAPTENPEKHEKVANDKAGEASFVRLLEKLSAEHNFDFREYKPASLARRVRARMQQVRVDTYPGYIEYLDRHPGEHVQLFNTILINVTGFFRDPEAWQALDEHVLPRLIDAASESRSLRVWSAGCSSGEEPYSVAMLLAEKLGDRAPDYAVKIYATDVDEDALAHGRQALYRVEDLKDVPGHLLERYFSREGQAYRFRRDFRRWCIFGRHNVAQDPPLSHIDLLLCRNVLIYFTTDLQDRILSRFRYAIREGGYLFLGRAESMLARSRWFVPRQVKWRIFERATTTPAAEAREGAPPVTARMEVGNVPRLDRIVDALPAGVMVIDAADNVLVWNGAAEILYEVPSTSAVGHKFRDLDVSYRVESLRARVEEVKAKHIPVRIDDATFTRRSGEVVHADISIVPVVDGERCSAVTVIATDATEQARLRQQMTRVAEQHATAIEELQSTNEELETTNEELQSTNEELETTNEELQSTNEELETTIEELQAANAELAALNAELEQRSGELRQLDQFSHTVMNSLEQSLIVLDVGGGVSEWNQAAERLWGLRRDQVHGHPLWTLAVGELPQAVRPVFGRVVKTGQPENLVVSLVGDTRRAAVRVAPLRGDRGEVVGVVLLAASENATG